MQHCKTLLVAATLLSLTNLNAQATLTTNFNGLGVYSSVSDVTWTQDANLINTLDSPYLSTNYNNTINAIINANGGVIHHQANAFDNGIHTLNAADFLNSAGGKVTWFGAQAFVHYLNTINYGGSSLWALPSAGANPQTGFNQTGGQPGQLYYLELNDLPALVPSANYGIFQDKSRDTSGNIGPFVNAHSYEYWTGTEASDTLGSQTINSAWVFSNYAGSQIKLGYGAGAYAWAVSPGHVSVVPIPSALWLFATAILGKLGLKRSTAVSRLKLTKLKRPEIQ